jgi:hypothetical protein
MLAEIDHLHDVGVRQRGADAGLVAEHLEEPGVERELRQDALDGEALLEAVRAGAAPDVHLGHPPVAEPLAELVGAEPIARRRTRQGHDRDRSPSDAERNPSRPAVARDRIR